MTASQISVFSESKPGHLSRVLDCLEEAGANVRGYSVADTGEYGILRFIVDKPDVASVALQAKGYASVVSQVICLKLIDKPGELARVMDLLAQNDINITYSYSMISTYIVIAVDDTSGALSLLEQAQLETVSQEDIARIVAERSKE